GRHSGGWQQVLAIGRGLMATPRLMLIDEASLGLAPMLVTRVFAAIETLVQRRVAFDRLDGSPLRARRFAGRDRRALARETRPSTPVPSMVSPVCSRAAPNPAGGPRRAGEWWPGSGTMSIGWRPPRTLRPRARSERGGVTVGARGLLWRGGPRLSPPPPPPPPAHPSR